MTQKTTPDAAILRGQIEDRFGSVPKFAARVGLSKVYIYKILRGDACPTLDAGSRIARSLGMSLDELALALGRPTPVETPRIA